MGLYVMLLGVQGAGKGEQAKFIERQYGIPQVSTGDLMRAMRTREDEFAKSVQATMDAGRLVDDETTNKIVVERLAKPDAQRGVIFDGYPRSTGQADFLEAYLAKKDEKLGAVLLLELDLFTAFKRAFGRVKTKPTEAKPEQVYNIYTTSDELDVRFEDDPSKQYPPRIAATLKSTGEELVRRADDANAASVIKRIDTYLETTQPLIEYYRGKGLLHTINAGQPIETVSAAIAKILDGAKAQK
jgi:adenylate kinase